MPAVSQAQQRVMAIALHDPARLQPQNRGLVKMSEGQLRDFAGTPRHTLPSRGALNPARARESLLAGMQG
jgi:hypothetical protein